MFAFLLLYETPTILVYSSQTVTPTFPDPRKGERPAGNWSVSEALSARGLRMAWKCPMEMDSRTGIPVPVPSNARSVFIVF